MARVIASKSSDINNNKHTMDVAETASLTTPTGIALTVGLIADSIRGGEAAATEAINAFLNSLRTSADNDAPSLMLHGYQAAHDRLRQLAIEEQTPFATTLAVAMVVNNQQLFVGNLGHSRIYLYSRATESLNPITIDHYFGILAVMQGRLTQAQANAHPDAQVLQKYIGMPRFLPPDMGIYDGSSISGEPRGREGLTLQEGDAILLTSDGLVKPNRFGQPIMTTNIITGIMTQMQGQVASSAIVNTASQQQPTDTISVVMMQMVGDQSAAVPRFSTQALIGGVASLLIFVAILLVAALLLSGAPAQEQGFNIAFVETYVAQTIEAFTPTATSTPTATPTQSPSPRPNQIAVAFTNAFGASDAAPIFVGQSVSVAGDYRLLDINHDPETITEAGKLYIQPFSSVRMLSMEDGQMRLSLRENSDIFVDTGGYPSAQVDIAEVPGFSFNVSGSCMSVHYGGSNTLIVSCYSGACGYRFGEGDFTPITLGEEYYFSLTTFNVISTGPIPLREAQRYEEILQRTFDVNVDTCISPYLPTTPTPTPTPIIIEIPTETPLPAQPTQCTSYGCR